MPVMLRNNGITISSNFGKSITEGTSAGGTQGSGAQLTFTIVPDDTEIRSLYVMIVPITGDTTDFWDNSRAAGPGGEPSDGFSLSGFVSTVSDYTFTTHINADRFIEGDEVFEIRVYRSISDAIGSAEPLIATRFTIIDDDGVGTAGHDSLVGTDEAEHFHGFAGNDTIDAKGGNDTLDGGTGADRLIGGAGDDFYFIDNAGDQTIETANGGNDTVSARISHRLAAHIEDLILTGSASISGTGNSLANRITGNDASNILDGGTGADLLIGGKGNDTYVVDNSGDVIFEAAGEGRDLVRSSVSYTLSDNVENLTLTGSKNINATGNLQSNYLIGNSGNNRLSGISGNDTLAGGAGNDVYIVVDPGAKVIEALDAGIDRVETSISYILTANVENLILTETWDISGTGNSLANKITGNAGHNRLDGKGGADTMIGGLGNDTYVVGASGDRVIEASGGGFDLVEASVSHTLAAYVENLTLTGSAGISGTGNSLANHIIGNAGNNRIDGMGGADTMAGGLGNDVYVIGSKDDRVIETANAGKDRIETTISYTLGANLEDLTLIGKSLSGTGNSLANVITGNDLANTLTGAGGNDTLRGGAGNDTLVGGTGSDLLVGGAGADRFVFRQTSESSTAAPDRIQDFSRTGGDRINLSAIDANSKISGDQAFKFTATAAFSKTAGELRYQADGANTRIEGDVNGDGRADFAITLLGTYKLLAGDFLL